MEDRILKLATEDYQNRKGKYPKSNIPDTIDIYKSENETYRFIVFFKNTSEINSINWFENYAKNNNLKILKIIAKQDGDYLDDWVCVESIVKDNIIKEE